MRSLSEIQSVCVLKQVVRSKLRALKLSLCFEFDYRLMCSCFLYDVVRISDHIASNDGVMSEQ